MRILLVGPMLTQGNESKTGGLSRYVFDILNSELTCDIRHFNISRPLKSKINNAQDGNSIVSGGLLRLIVGLVITLRNMIIFPFVLMRYSPDIVHIAATSGLVFFEDSYYLILSKIFRKKIFLHYLGAFDLYYNTVGKFHKYFIQTILRMCDHIALLSERVHSIVKEFGKIKAVSVIPSGINMDDYLNSENKKSMRSDDVVRILFLGGFDAIRKGIVDIVEAIPKVAAKNHNALFLLSTSKSILLTLEKSDNILPLDWIPIEEKIRLYKDCDIFLLPSYNEGLPYSMIEAMAAGMAIIASDVGGIPEAVKDGVNGIIVRPGSVSDIVNSLNFLIENKETRVDMGKENIALVREKYSVSRNMQIIFEIYKNMMKDTPK
jgi:glycosyltransferase involved in cell wall biosynthesis